MGCFFPKLGPPEDPALGLLRDELAQTNVKLLRTTEDNAKAREQLTEDEKTEAQLRVKVASFKKAIQLLEDRC